MSAIALRPLKLEADLDLVHGWMQQPHVAPWWELAGARDVVRSYLQRQAALAHVQLWVATDERHGAFGYVETYRAADDPLASYYDGQPGDRGFHLLVGPPELLGRGLGHALVRHVAERLLREPGATRVVCEPDVRNARMLACCLALGGERLATIEQPGRRAVLIGWTRLPSAVMA